MNVRMNISIPEELKTRLDRFPDVNWSKVAADAIVAKLKDLSPKKGRTPEDLELDAAIAENLFGWKLVQTDYTARTGQLSGMIDAYKDETGELRTLDEVPRYSDDVDLTAEVIKAASRKHIGINIMSPKAGEDRLVRGFQKGKSIMFASADTLEDVPAAVCKVIARLFGVI